MRRTILVLVLLAGGIAGYAVWQRRAAPATAAASPAVPVLVATSTRRDVPVFLDAIGTVQAFNTVSVKPMVSGPLVEMRFREGQDVRTGDVLARIDPRPYQATLDQYTAKKAQDEATLANARLDLARYQKLVANNYTSGQTADTQRATVAQDEALVRQDQAQIDSARTQLGYTTIASPIDGRTGIRQVDIGNIVNTTDTTPLTVITQLQPISVVFTLPQQDLPAVSAALQAGSPEVLASPQGGLAGQDDGGAPPVLDRGVVAVLDNQVDPTTGTIKLKATLPNAGLKLWPGGFVDVRLLVNTERQVVTVPPAAVQRGPRGDYVFAVGATERIERRPVRIGYGDERVAVVTDGLQPGTAVVTDGVSRLTDGTLVAPSTAPADGTASDGAESQAAPGLRPDHPPSHRDPS